MTASFRGVGSLNLQQLSSVLSSLCPGMLAEARNLPRTFLQNDGDRKWISWDQLSICIWWVIIVGLVVGNCVYNSFYRFSCVSGRCWSTLLALLWRWWVFLRSAWGVVLSGLLQCCLKFSLDDRSGSYGFSCNMVHHDTTYFHQFSSFLAVWPSSPRRLWEKSEMPLRSICSCVDCQPCSRYLSVLSHFWGPHSWRVFRMCLFSLYIWQDCDKSMQITASSLCWGTGQRLILFQDATNFSACLAPTSSNLSQRLAKAWRDPGTCLGFGKVLIDKAADFEACGVEQLPKL